MFPIRPTFIFAAKTAVAQSASRNAAAAEDKVVLTMWARWSGAIFCFVSFRCRPCCSLLLFSVAAATELPVAHRIRKTTKITYFFKFPAVACRHGGVSTGRVKAGQYLLHV